MAFADHTPLQDIKAGFRTRFGIAFLIYYGAMAILGLLIPGDILQANPWARDFTHFMSSIVPQIDRIAALGIAPDINRFYFSLLWATAPIAFVLCAGGINEGRRSRRAAMWVTPFPKAIIPVALSAFAVSWGAYGLWNVDPTMTLSRTLFGSSLGRAFMGQVVFFQAPVFFATALSAFAVGWMTGYIPRRIREQKHGT